MNWREQLQPASFKGAPFGVMGDDKEGGRRTVVHEFPQREDVFVEDLGAATNRFTLQAFVVGDDYFSKRDSLEKALNEPGPGTLVHPWYGEITVSQFAPYKVKHSAADGGLAVFTLSLARDGEPGAPAASVNASARAFSAIGRGQTLACQLLASMLHITGQPAHVGEEARLTTEGLLESLQTAFWGKDNGQSFHSSDSFQRETSLANTLWNTCRQLADSSASSSAKLGATWLEWAVSQSTKRLERQEHTEKMGKQNLSRRVIESNDAALTLFFFHLALLEAARHLALARPESRTQARVLREQFVDAVDTLTEESAFAGQENFLNITPVSQSGAGASAEGLANSFFTALVETRAATLQVLAEKARKAPDVVAHTPAAVLPALVLCYRLSGSIALHDDLLTRNTLVHPGFVPVKRLEVLTNG